MAANSRSSSVRSMGALLASAVSLMALVPHPAGVLADAPIDQLDLRLGPGFFGLGQFGEQVGKRPYHRISTIRAVLAHISVRSEGAKFIFELAEDACHADLS